MPRKSKDFRQQHQYIEGKKKKALACWLPRRREIEASSTECRLAHRLFSRLLLRVVDAHTVTVLQLTKSSALFTHWLKKHNIWNFSRVLNLFDYSGPIWNARTPNRDLFLAFSHVDFTFASQIATFERFHPIMTVMSVGELSVNLQRDGCNEPFGFRLRGGTDIREAFIIQRVKLFPIFFPPKYYVEYHVINTARYVNNQLIDGKM